MSTYSELVTGLAIGAATADQFAAVGTIRVRNRPGAIIGFWVNGTANANTANEAYSFQVDFDLGEFGLKHALLGGNCCVGEGIGTQSGGFGGPAVLYPANILFTGNEALDITAAHCLPAPSAGLNVQAGILYWTDGRPPAEFWQYYPDPMPMQGGDLETDGALTANDVAIAALEIPGFPRHISSLGGALGGQDAAARTAEDVVLGLNFTSTFEDFTPQQYPIAYKYPNLLGTLVGKGIHINGMPCRWPAYIDTQNKAGTITPHSLMATAPTDAHSVTATCEYTKA